MSDLNNKHLPSDIDSLTRKNLVELWLIQAEEHKKMLAEIEQLKAQIATSKPELTFETCFHTFIDEIAIRDLEQQAKGVGYVLDLQSYSCMNEPAIMAQDIHGLCVSLKSKAKEQGDGH